MVKTYEGVEINGIKQWIGAKGDDDTKPLGISLCTSLNMKWNECPTISRSFRRLIEVNYLRIYKSVSISIEISIIEERANTKWPFNFLKIQ